MAILIFSIAMAALEGAVVVYLRELYYPDGFTVALKLMDRNIILVELMREAATIVMLAAIGWLAGDGFKDRLGYFFLSFAIWDIFYYVWLKVFIDWPSTFFEWDILFLIPITWLGPVWAPVVCSLSMIALAFALFFSNDNSAFSKNVGWFILGSLLVLLSFMWDYGGLILGEGYWREWNGLLEDPQFLARAKYLVPNEFHWGIFGLGELLIMAGIVQIIKK
ncbi:MAG: hypothetical protein K2Q22_04235 [Cytophagales bacterium]|nr:hypothetical protein [Cytophagales bacterium]